MVKLTRRNRLALGWTNSVHQEKCGLVLDTPRRETNPMGFVDLVKEIDHIAKCNNGNSWRLDLFWRDQRILNSEEVLNNLRHEGVAHAVIC